MGQCSTLPTEGRSANSSRRGSESASVRKEDPLAQRQKETISKSPMKKRSSFVQHHHAPMQQEQPQSRNPETQHYDESEPMEEENGREDIPQPPEIATRTRCYKFNLDAEKRPQAHAFLGPFAEEPPALTYSSSEDSLGATTPTQIAVRTAQIFRGITVSKDGTILSQNARATRSNRGKKNMKGEKSRQAAKIEQAKDLVEESIRTGKAPDSDKPATMLSLVIMGEYDDMKYLVRDGSKKLREASDLPDESLLAVNRYRGAPESQSTVATLLSPRKRASPNFVSGQRNAALQSPSSKSRYSGLPQSAPPKLKSHPRDHPSTRRLGEDRRSRERNPVHGVTSSSSHRQAAGDAEWTSPLNFSRGFHSLWNCGATGMESGSSPTRMAFPNDKVHNTAGAAAPHYNSVFEGRDSQYRQSRESGSTARAN